MLRKIKERLESNLISPSMIRGAKFNHPEIRFHRPRKEIEYGRYETYLIPGEPLIPGGKGEAFHPGIGYAS